MERQIKSLLYIIENQEEGEIGLNSETKEELAVYLIGVLRDYRLLKANLEELARDYNKIKELNIIFSLSKNEVTHLLYILKNYSGKRHRRVFNSLHQKVKYARLHSRKNKGKDSVMSV